MNSLNKLFCGLTALLLMVIVITACSGKGDGDKSAAKNESVSNSASANESGGKASAAPASDFEYDLTRNGKGVKILKYKGKGGNIIVPSEIEGMPVTTLGDDPWGEGGAYRKEYYDRNGKLIFSCPAQTSRSDVFKNTKVTSVVLPDSISLLYVDGFNYDEYRMFGDTPLREITFPAGTNLIPGYWFYNCKNLKSIEIPSTVKVIGSSAFRFSGLTSVVIPEGVQIIEENAFEGCKDLKSVTIPESIIAISDAAFKDCSSLEVINMPSKKIHYGYVNGDEVYNVFSGCTKLSLAARKAISDSGYTGNFTN